MNRTPSRALTLLILLAVSSVVGGSAVADDGIAVCTALSDRAAAPPVQMDRAPALSCAWVAAIILSLQVR